MSDPAAAPADGPGPRGVVFDLDGVIADTESLWTESWIDCARRHGAGWTHDDSTEVMGMSGPEWSRHVSEHIRGQAGSGPDAEEVYAECVGFVVRAVEEGRGPLLDGADDLVRDIASRVPVALASSAAREVIDTVLRRAGMTEVFAATVSSEEVPHGKPAPDVYAEALRRLGGEVAGHGLAVEDSTNGIRSASAAGLTVVAIPNPHFPPRPEALALAALVAEDHRHARDYVLSLIGDDEGAHPGGTP